jgi:hypothetical protein
MVITSDTIAHSCGKPSIRSNNAYPFSAPSPLRWACYLSARAPRRAGGGDAALLAPAPRALRRRHVPQTAGAPTCASSRGRLAPHRIRVGPAKHGPAAGVAPACTRLAPPHLRWVRPVPSLLSLPRRAPAKARRCWGSSVVGQESAGHAAGGPGRLQARAAVARVSRRPCAPVSPPLGWQRVYRGAAPSPRRRVPPNPPRRL